MSPQAVAFDIGGSKTHAVLVDANGVLAEATTGAGNISSVGVATARAQLSDALTQLGATDVRVVCAGAAGADSPEQKEALTALLTELVPQAELIVLHDAQLLLAAAGLDTGIALISGTGSVAWGCTPDGRSGRAGGWGYLLGDDGSGYGVARDAVKHVLGQLDRGETPDRLTDALLAACDLETPDQLLQHFYAHAERRYWARKAIVVFTAAAAGDAAALRIVSEAASALVDVVRTVSRKLGSAGPLVCAGGLVTHQPTLLARLRTELAAEGITDIRLLDQAPVHGAARIAQQALLSTDPRT